MMNGLYVTLHQLHPACPVLPVSVATHETFYTLPSGLELHVRHVWGGRARRGSDPVALNWEAGPDDSAGDPLRVLSVRRPAVRGGSHAELPQRAWSERIGEISYLVADTSQLARVFLCGFAKRGRIARLYFRGVRARIEHAA